MRSSVRTKFAFIGLFLAGIPCGSLLTGVAIAGQPHMVNTLHALQSAQAELNQAVPHKGGHRENALNLVQQAIGEVHRGIRYADNR